MQVFVLDKHRKIVILNHRRANTGTFEQYKRRTAMTHFEAQVLETERRYDRMIREIEQHDPNVLNSVVPGSRLHDIIHNPVTEGIDEG